MFAIIVKLHVQIIHLIYHAFYSNYGYCKLYEGSAWTGHKQFDSDIKH